MHNIITTIILPLGLMASIASAAPTTQPTPNAAERAQVLKDQLKSFRLDLEYHGAQDKPYYGLWLSVPPLSVRRSNPFHPHVRISEVEASKIIDHLAREGFLDQAVDNTSGMKRPAPSPCYTMIVFSGEEMHRHEFSSVLGWNLPMVRRLDGLRAVLEGESGKQMDLLLGRLSGHRSEWEREAALPFDRLAAQLSSSPLWQNGISPIIALPQTASTEQVVSKVFETISFDQGKVTQHRVLEVRQVRIKGSLPDQYTAALVETNLGEKIVLLRHEGGPMGWWSRVYHSDPPATAGGEAAWQINLKKKDDKVAIAIDGEKTIFTITSPSGIGSATVGPKSKQWPATVVVRLHLRGLESFAVSNGTVKVSAAWDGKLAREQLWVEGKEGPALDASNRLWVNMRAFDAAGKPAVAVPIQDGWFEVMVPNTILDEGASLKLDWIDFHRN